MSLTSEEVWGIKSEASDHDPNAEPSIIPKIGSLWPSHIRPPACASCPIGKRSKGFVPGFGVFACRNLRIGERPGTHEVEEGKPFVHTSGKWLNKAQAAAPQSFTTNIRKCLIGEESKAERIASIDYCVQAYLVPELEAIATAQRAAGIEKGATLLVGADATRVFLRRANITKLHGTIWTAGEVKAMAAAGGKVEEDDSGTPE